MNDLRNEIWTCKIMKKNPRVVIFIQNYFQTEKLSHIDTIL